SAGLQRGPGPVGRSLRARARPPAGSARLDEAGAAEAAIVGAAPPVLRDRVKSASWSTDEGGVVVDLDGAPELRFGDGSRAEDKWQAVAAVLSSDKRGSPSYLDVSVPDRPVSGGFASG